MAKTRLLQAVCTVAMLAAVPALAQQPGVGTTGSSAPAAQQPAPTYNSSDMAPANQGRAASSDRHATHRSATHSSRTDTSQNAAVDRLNDQSYQAAQQGQSFGGVGGSDTGSGTTTPTGSGGTSGMSNGSVPGNASGGTRY